MVSGDSAPPLIWSLSRKLRRRWCPRAAVIHYREAYHGYHPDADAGCRDLNFLHRIVPLNKYIRQLLLAVMRESFYRNSTAPETLTVMALEKWEYDFRRMVFGNAPLLLDLIHRNGNDFSALKKEVKETLIQRCEQLACGAWKELLAVPPLRRRFIASPLKLNINELCCYASPLLAYSDQGTLRIVELREGSIGAHPEILLMHRFYALNVSGRSPAAVISCQLDPADGSFRQFDTGDSCYEILQSMNREAAAHQAELQLPLTEVPVNNINCPRCVFDRYCRNKLKNNVI